MQIGIGPDLTNGHWDMPAELLIQLVKSKV